MTHRTPGGGQARLVLPVDARDHVQGLSSAPATLLEYGDTLRDALLAVAPVNA